MQYKLKMTDSAQEKRIDRGKRGGSMTVDAAAKNVRTRIENVKSSLNEAGKSSAVLASVGGNSHRMPV